MRRGCVFDKQFRMESQERNVGIRGQGSGVREIKAEAFRLIAVSSWVRGQRRQESEVRMKG